MAEFLVKAIDANHPNPVKDQAGCYKRGDVVVVKPDGWQWGKLECPPKFVIVKIPDMSVESARKYIESEKDVKDPENPRILTRRKYKFHIDWDPIGIRLGSDWDPIGIRLGSDWDPIGIRNGLTSKGIAIITKIQAVGFLRKKAEENHGG